MRGTTRDKEAFVPSEPFEIPSTPPCAKKHCFAKPSPPGTDDSVAYGLNEDDGTVMPLNLDSRFKEAGNDKSMEPRGLDQKAELPNPEANDLAEETC